MVGTRIVLGDRTGGSGAAGGADASMRPDIGCDRSLAVNGIGGTVPPELGRLTDLVEL
jgi:hypothetical protein